MKPLVGCFFAGAVHFSFQVQLAEHCLPQARATVRTLGLSLFGNQRSPTPILGVPKTNRKGGTLKKDKPPNVCPKDAAANT